jgi:mono/diheme cytochrome c family protein
MMASKNRTLNPAGVHEEKGALSRRLAACLPRKRAVSPRGVVAILMALGLHGCGDRPMADPTDGQQVALGKTVYDRHCAACHGANLEGQPNWRERLPGGRLPAPPHDATGHTWHHADTLLFAIVRDGIEPHVLPGYESDMPAFGGRLSEAEIWAVLAYIKSAWPAETRRWQSEVSTKARTR